jgi:predicted CoA-binding protein
MQEAAEEFLSQRRIAVAGVSREEGSGHGGNVVYQRLRERGYEVFAVNPNADVVMGDKAYPDLASIPGGVEAVVIATHPDVAEDVMAQCANVGVRQVWIHRGPGPGSYSDAAAELGRKWGLTVIPSGCPLMFGPTADGGHKVMRWVFNLVGRIPKQI